MARVTIEDCLLNVDNMYELVHLATKRSRQIYRGSNPLVKSKNRVIVTALREIAAKKVSAAYGQPGGDNEMPPVAN
jgi:DNA-directed RNA polymerase subunit omega